MRFGRILAGIAAAAALCAALSCRAHGAETGLRLARQTFACAAPFLADYTVTDETGNSVLSGEDYSELCQLTAGEQSIAAYSADAAGRLLAEDTYRRENLEDAGCFDSQTAGKIRAVVLSGYPCRDTASIQANANVWLHSRGMEEIRELQSGEAVLACQLALWQLTNPGQFTIRQYLSGWEDMTTAGWREYRKQVADTAMLSQKPTDFTAWNVEALCRYFGSLAPAEPGLDTVSGAALVNPAYTAQQQPDGTYTVTVSVDIQTDVGDRDELTLSGFCGTQTDSREVSAAGTYSVCFTGLTDRLEVRLVISGIQHGGDVYLFEGTGRSLVGYDDSLLPVSGELTVKPDCILNLYESNQDGIPLANVRFDLYRVATREQIDNGEFRLAALCDGETLAGYRTPGNLVTILTTDIHGFASYNFTANGQPEGVYLAVQRDGNAGEAAAAPFFLRLPAATAEGDLTYTLNVHPIAAAETAPTVRLEIENQLSASFDVGQPHTWTVEGSVPAGVAAARSYTLTDALDSRLQYEAGSLTAAVVAADGEETKLREGDHYTLTVTDQTVSLSLTPAGMAYAGGKGAEGEIRVRFRTAIRETAEPGTPIANRIRLSYLNSGGIAFEAESDPAEVHTGGIRLRVTNGAGKPLPGAVFRICREDVPVAELTTGEDGTATCPGLAYGGYTLTQTKVPEGYDPMPGALAVTVNETSYLTAADGWRDTQGRIVDNTIPIYCTEAVVPRTGDTTPVAFVVAGSALIGLLCSAALELTVRSLKRRSRR